MMAITTKSSISVKPAASLMAEYDLHQVTSRVTRHHGSARRVRWSFYYEYDRRVLARWHRSPLVRESSSLTGQGHPV